ncbi:hypothetical protein [Nocardioides sp. Kera G14]|uniref:hypothetical protein n=1 Tax=Nocardioides sp. Kera G14 TaxID=2884264 RepID=UPI001D110279|nr:hypothetical protein [Nocardioides sp. Kera G14]UDY25158.1 hypothetical protein LH076_07680 [Nocardioides sp. Kera G14]
MTDHLMDEGAALTQEAQEPWRGQTTVPAADPEPDETNQIRAEFEWRLEERTKAARYPHSLRRLTYSARELNTIKAIDQQAAVWIPIITFAVTAVCAVGVVLVATRVADDPVHGRLSDVVVVLLTLGLLGAGFGTLSRSQAWFDSQRPPGRSVRTDLADAYETVREGVAVFLELGVLPGALGRIADLVPRSELLLDFLLAHEARGGTAKGHPAYEELIRMGAEVTVLTDMAEERLGRRSVRRRDRRADPESVAPSLDDVTPFATLADLVEMLAVDIPAPRRADTSASDGASDKPERSL